MSIYSDDYTHGAEEYVTATNDHDPMEWERGGQDREEDQRDPDVFGSGFFVVAGATTRWTVPACRYCGTNLFVPALSWWCEFDDLVTERPRVGAGRVCMCNACAWNECVFPTGRPPEFCDGIDCRRRRAREERARERERQNERARDTATRWLVDFPALTNREIATRSGVLPIRVREARTLVTA